MRKNIIKEIGELKIILDSCVELNDFDYKITHCNAQSRDEFNRLWDATVSDNKIKSCYVSSDILSYEIISNKFNRFEYRNKIYYSYFPFGILYRIDDLDSCVFYIGETMNREAWENGYLGTGGRKWRNHKRKYPPIDSHIENDNSHRYIRTVLRDNFITPIELLDSEFEEISKFFKYDETKSRLLLIDKNCMNSICVRHGSYPTVRKSAEQYHCEECGSPNNHKKTCSKYKERKRPNPCQECGSISQHKKSCSKFKSPERNVNCEECKTRGPLHKKTCSKYRVPVPCEECGAIVGHKKSCPKYKIRSNCEICGGAGNNHYKWCNNFKGNKSCQECGSKSTHKVWCSKFKYQKNDNSCKECGSKNCRHKKDCSKYRKLTVCSECGGKGGIHYKTCSYYKPHKKTQCRLCGSCSKHKSTCPNNPKNKTI